MKHATTSLVLALPLLLSAQEPAPAPTPAQTPQAAQESVRPDPETVLATVNGTPIREKDMEARFQLQIQAQTGGMQIPEAQLGPVREQLRPQILSDLIDDMLLDQAVQDKGIELSDEEVLAYLRRSLDAQLTMNGKTMEELEEILQETQGTDVETFMKTQAANPDLRRTLAQVKLVETVYPDEVKVTDEEIKADYDSKKESQYTRAAEVHARHILIGTDGMTTDEQRAEARAKAEEVLALAHAEGADFAALAREYSTGPSAANGGDLGFFPRTGAMVEPFAKAAFELAVGGVSDIVETQFGYHIIQVTERHEASVVPFDRAKPWIRDELRFTKVGPQRAKLLEELRDNAEIVYPE